jgi:hypothetical protein
MSDIEDADSDDELLASNLVVLSVDEVLVKGKET